MPKDVGSERTRKEKNFLNPCHLLQKEESAKRRAQRALRAHAPHVPYVPYAPTCPKYILQTGKLKISVLMKSNEGSFSDVFKGAEF